LNTRPARRSRPMPHANVRQDEPSRGGTVVPLFPASSAREICPECGRLIRTKRPAGVCSPRCRASASRRRRVEAALGRLDAAERGLRDALDVVQQLRGLLIFRGTP
jgi:hypothetical protein